MRNFDKKNLEKDKIIEFDRYELRAKKSIKSNKLAFVNYGSNSLKKYLRSPYFKYEEIIREQILNSNHEVLELTSGMGEFSRILIESESKLICTDISKTSLRTLQKKYKKIKKVNCQVVDIENLPYSNDVFDYVFIAGGLSYGDNDLVLKEIYRVLKIGGKFIAVDSLNHNPIYKLNRWIHWLLGKRSKSTLKRMPKVSLIEKYIKLFGEGKVYYFGSFSWFFNLFPFLFSFENINKFSNWLDSLICVKKSAFKFVLVVKKNE